MKLEKAIHILKDMAIFYKIEKTDDNLVNKMKIEAIETVLKALEELQEYKKIAELTKISCCTAQNCEALNNAIRSELENENLKTFIIKRKLDKEYKHFIKFERGVENESIKNN